MVARKPVVINFRQDVGKPLPSYHLDIRSEVTELENTLTDNFSVTTATRPFVPSPFGVVKVFEFRLIKESGNLGAGCKAFFANSVMLQHYGAQPERIIERIPVSDDTLRDRFAEWLATSTNFVYLADFCADLKQDKRALVNWFLLNAPFMLAAVYGFTFQQVIAAFPSQEPTCIGQIAGTRELERMRKEMTKERLFELKLDLGYDFVDTGNVILFTKDVRAPIRA